MASKTISPDPTLDQLNLQELGKLARTWKTQKELLDEARWDKRALRVLKEFTTEENFRKFELYLRIHPDESPDDVVWTAFEQEIERLGAEMATPVSAVEC